MNDTITPEWSQSGTASSLPSPSPICPDSANGADYCWSLTTAGSTLIRGPFITSGYQNVQLTYSFKGTNMNGPDVCYIEYSNDGTTTFVNEVNTITSNSELINQIFTTFISGDDNPNGINIQLRSRRAAMECYFNELKLEGDRITTSIPTTLTPTTSIPTSQPTTLMPVTSIPTTLMPTTPTPTTSTPTTSIPTSIASDPTSMPTAPTVEPTFEPSSQPTLEPTIEPSTQPITAAPTSPTVSPTTATPTSPTIAPTTSQPTSPTSVPSLIPTTVPTTHIPTSNPITNIPTTTNPTTADPTTTMPTTSVSTTTSSAPTIEPTYMPISDTVTTPETGNDDSYPRRDGVLGYWDDAEHFINADATDIEFLIIIVAFLVTLTICLCCCYCMQNKKTKKLKKTLFIFDPEYLQKERAKQQKQQNQPAKNKNYEDVPDASIQKSPRANKDVLPPSPRGNVDKPAALVQQSSDQNLEESISIPADHALDVLSTQPPSDKPPPPSSPPPQDVAKNRFRAATVNRQRNNIPKQNINSRRNTYQPNRNNDVEMGRIKFKGRGGGAQVAQIAQIAPRDNNGKNKVDAVIANNDNDINPSDEEISISIPDANASKKVVDDPALAFLSNDDLKNNNKQPHMLEKIFGSKKQVIQDSDDSEDSIAAKQRLYADDDIVIPPMGVDDDGDGDKKVDPIAKGNDTILNIFVTPPQPAPVAVPKKVDKPAPVAKHDDPFASMDMDMDVFAIAAPSKPEPKPKAKDDVKPAAKSVAIEPKKDADNAISAVDNLLFANPEFGDNDNIFGGNNASAVDALLNSDQAASNLMDFNKIAEMKKIDAVDYDKLTKISDTDQYKVVGTQEMVIDDKGKQSVNKTINKNNDIKPDDLDNILKNNLQNPDNKNNIDIISNKNDDNNDNDDLKKMEDELRKMDEMIAQQKNKNAAIKDNNDNDNDNPFADMNDDDGGAFKSPLDDIMASAGVNKKDDYDPFADMNDDNNAFKSPLDDIMASSNINKKDNDDDNPFADNNDNSRSPLDQIMIESKVNNNDAMLGGNSSAADKVDAPLVSQQIIQAKPHQTIDIDNFMGQQNNGNNSNNSNDDDDDDDASVGSEIIHGSTPRNSELVRDQVDPNLFGNNDDDSSSSDFSSNGTDPNVYN